MSDYITLAAKASSYTATDGKAQGLLDALVDAVRVLERKLHLAKAQLRSQKATVEKYTNVRRVHAALKQERDVATMECKRMREQMQTRESLHAQLDSARTEVNRLKEVNARLRKNKKANVKEIEHG